jgi:hypothetical protein
MTTPIKIDIWSDIACPWCYIGKRRLEKAVGQFATSPGAPPVEIEYHSYQLDPNTPADYPARMPNIWRNILVRRPPTCRAHERAAAPSRSSRTRTPARPR